MGHRPDKPERGKSAGFDPEGFALEALFFVFIAAALVALARSC